MKTGLKYFGLRQWELEEYTSIEDELAQEIERQGGTASVEHLVSTLTRNFGVSVSSVKAYIAGPNFVRTTGGDVAVPTKAISPTQHRPIELTKKCYRTDGQCVYKVLVTEELLRGSGIGLPIAVATLIGSKPGDTRSFSADSGDVLVTWPSIRPTISSLRRPAEDLGASVGDYLFIEFDSQDRVRFRLGSNRRFESAMALERVALEVDVGAAESSEELIRKIAYSLWLDASEPSIADIRARLRERRETDLLEHMPESDSVNDDDSLSELLSLLGI